MGPHHDIEDEEETVGYLCAIFVIVFVLVIVFSVAKAIKAALN